MAEIIFLSQKNLRSSILGLVWLSHDAISWPDACRSLFMWLPSLIFPMWNVAIASVFAVEKRKRKQEWGKSGPFPAESTYCKAYSWKTYRKTSAWLSQGSLKNVVFQLRSTIVFCDLQNKTSNFCFFCYKTGKKNCERPLYPFLETYPVPEPLMSPSPIPTLF